MPRMNNGMFGRDRDDWETPQDLFRQYDDRWHYFEKKGSVRMIVMWRLIIAVIIATYGIWAVWYMKNS